MLPALRQPKIVQISHEQPKKSLPPEKFVIITLKGEQKLVVTSDAYNGIVSMGEVYKCVFCEKTLDMNQSANEIHIYSGHHVANLDRNPHVEEFSQNLIRTLSDDSKYCTICHVIVANVKLMNHISSEVHLQELERAANRALTYKPHEV